jgi:DNA mismatch repair protein MutH
MMGANMLQSLLAHTTQSKSQKFQQDFEQLGQDLQSGNVTRGQADLTALQSDMPTLQPSPSSPNLNSQMFNQMAQDLQSGNLTAAQSDYATLQQNLQPGGGHAHHFHAHGSGGGSALSQMQQDLAQLGQALQSGNLNAAQQAYTTFQADTMSLGSLGGSAASSAGSSAVAGLNVAG